MKLFKNRFLISRFIFDMFYDTADCYTAAYADDNAP